MNAPFRRSQTAITQCVHDIGHPLGPSRAADDIRRCRAPAGMRTWSRAFWKRRQAAQRPGANDPVAVPGTVRAGMRGWPGGRSNRCALQGHALSLPGRSTLASSPLCARSGGSSSRPRSFAVFALGGYYAALVPAVGTEPGNSQPRHRQRGRRRTLCGRFVGRDGDA